MNWTWLLPFLAVCLGTSFLLSGMEAGVFALSRLRVRQLVRRGQPRAKILHEFLEKPEDFLWTILVGNTLANFAVVAVLVIVLHDGLRLNPWVEFALFIVVVFLFYVLCDLLPKTLFRRFPNRLCLALARPFRLAHGALAPLVWLLARLADTLLRWTGGKIFTGHLFTGRDELRRVMQESAQDFTSEERAMINRVLDLQQLTVRQVMVPLEKIVSIGARTPMTEVLRLCHENHLTRLPVWDEIAGRKKITGITSIKTLLYQADFDPQRAAGDYVKPAPFLPEEMRLEEALQRIQKSGLRMAVVLRADGRESGILCLEDVLKAVFGEVAL
ncbi:MAG: DUF21 domain-containing protein [Verrucomicrobia bacterium]|nr:DUF21 domain-containing protein [Verrucomicrobiota bacterium]